MNLPTFACLAALLAVPAGAAEPSFSADRIKADVTFLADDLLEGRGTGTRGHEIAARYVAAQFAVAGLQPGGENGGWYRRLTFQERRLTGPTATVDIAGPGLNASFANGVGAVVAPSTADPLTDITADAVFVGWGIDAPAQGFDDYRGLDVRGKYVVVLSGIPKGPPDEVIAHLQTQKPVYAAAHGAIGVITIQTLDTTRRRPWPRVVATATVPRMTWMAGDRPHADAPAIRAAATLDSPGAQALFTGAPVRLDKLLAAADRPGARIKGFALPAQVRVRAGTAFRTLTSPEVVGLIPGTDPALVGETVVLMGHLDHLGIRTDKDGDQIYNGALDNAAGVATMLEVARGFAAAPRPRRSMLFVANTAEEKGLLGAAAFADNPGVPIEGIVAVVDLDEPLLLYDFVDINAFGDTHSTIGPVVARAAAAVGVKLSPDPTPEETTFVRSDHYAFVKRGVPAIMLSTGFGGAGAAAWADYNKNRYHQPSDDLSQTIVWSAGAKFARVNYLIARELADGAGRPRWYAGDYFGDTFAPGQLREPRPAAP